MGVGGILIAATPLPALAGPADLIQAQKILFGDRQIREGRVKLKLPAIAENGYSVPLSVDVDSPMTDNDHVRQIAIFSPRNPIAEIVRFELGPRAGRAAVSTRIRLGGTQTVQAVAEFSDGSLWSGSANTVVTLAACVVL
jgi:sulfur-oxidizing protein SoxY